MGPELHAAIGRLRSAWDEQVRPSSRRALLALVVATLVGSAHLGRLGVPAARLGAFAVVAVVLVALLARALVTRRRSADVRHVVRATVSKTDPALGGATLRALGLVDRSRADDSAGSPALARLHLARLLGRASLERVTARAARAARRWSAAGLLLAACALVAVLAEPLRVVEGFDVLAARSNEAPLRLFWIEDVSVVARPPEYLHDGERHLLPFEPASLARGSVLTVRGRALHPGRRLVVTDGQTEVAFVDDGSGGVVARWELAGSASLAVAAKLGEVRIRQPDEQAVESIADEAPRVVVERAPRTVRLLDEPSISLRYEASDDHGLREVSVVLRAGTREERRVLSKPATDAKTDRGGYELRSVDPFFKRTYVPVEVRIEARDNDQVTGPKWGKSAPIVVVPPEVGEPQALRYAALVEARGALVDLLADRLGQSAPTAKTRREHVAHESAVQGETLSAVERALAGSYGGLRVRGRSAVLVRGQLRRLDKALSAEMESGSRESHDKLLAETESVLLALDMGVRSLGATDSRMVAKRLADVADEAAAAAWSASIGADVPGASARLDASVSVLDGGGRQLLRLGDLGLDLGEIVANDLRRIARARAAEDLRHAELAARDLAARLRRPEPSFGSSGGRGVESGGAPSPDSAMTSEAVEQSDASGEELERLAQEHASEMNEVAQALELTPDEAREMREQAREHAESIRRAVEKLPPSGRRDSTEGAAAEGRDQAESMAGQLERGDRITDAVESGKQALRALDEARRLAEPGSPSDERTADEAARAKQALERELAWAEQTLEKLRRMASERAREELGKSSKDEAMLAERAKELGKKGESGDGAMPEDMLDRLGEAEEAMREAERALGEGDGQAGLEHQKRAQRLLEMAQGQAGHDGDEGRQEGDDAKSLARDAHVPDKEKFKGPADFRRRVLEGLGATTDPLLKEAVKRYAEGLLE